MLPVDQRSDTPRSFWRASVVFATCASVNSRSIGRAVSTLPVVHHLAKYVVINRAVAYLPKAAHIAFHVAGQT